MNNSKLILFLSCLAALTLTAPLVRAAPRGSGGGHHFASMPARGGQTFARSGMGTWSGQNNVIFIGDFGFPWAWGWGWGGSWGYPYGYYGYGYPYGYGGYGYGYGDPYGYGSQYGYDNNYYGNNYGSNGYGSPTHSRVAELQRRLARAGYYYGTIDGILGPRTRQAIRAYERDHSNVG